MITRERLKQLLSYDPETGVFRWRARLSNRIRAEKSACTICGKPSLARALCRNHYYFAQRRGVLGQHSTLTPSQTVDHVAGTANRLLKGRRYICIEGKSYLAARLAWLYCHGVWPPHGVDHVNGNPADDRLANLRLATQSENMRNTGIPSHNTSGIKGVHFNKRRNKWIAQIGLNRNRHYLGGFDTPDAAQAAYCAAVQRLHGEFARVE